MEEEIVEVYGMSYCKPKVTVIANSNLVVSEVAARTCYNSFESSENETVKTFPLEKDELEEVSCSKLLTNLAWTTQHHSILEHVTISYFVEGISRGVLQEHARHRMQGISVKSTRYTLQSVLNAFITTVNETDYERQTFIKLVEPLDLFVTTDKNYNSGQISDMFDRLRFQYTHLGREEFITQCIPKSSLHILEDGKVGIELFMTLEKGKKKRNVGDPFKHIVNDNWKTDMVITFNLRSLKNYFKLRDSGAAWFQIQWLAKAMKEVTDDKYLNLIVKS